MKGVRIRDVRQLYSDDYDETFTQAEVDLPTGATVTVGITVPNSGTYAGGISSIKIRMVGETPITNADFRKIPISTILALAITGRPAEAQRLRRPGRGFLTGDEFYGAVARAYLDALANGLPTAATIAQEAEVPIGTARRWVLEARRRGILRSHV